MKVVKFKQELGQMSDADLHERLDSIRRELFSLRLNISTTHNKDYSAFKKLRKDTARILTFIRTKTA